VAPLLLVEMLLLPMLRETPPLLGVPQMLLLTMMVPTLMMTLLGRIRLLLQLMLPLPLLELTHLLTSVRVTLKIQPLLMMIELVPLNLSKQ
jgi:hypothetical protein